MSLWDVMVSIFWFMLLVAWFWLLISIISDIFRDHELSGVGKGLWCTFVILLPWLGVLVYLIARGRSMSERAAKEAEDAHEHGAAAALGRRNGSVANRGGDLAWRQPVLPRKGGDVLECARTGVHRIASRHVSVARCPASRRRTPGRDRRFETEWAARSE